MRNIKCKTLKDSLDIQNISRKLKRPLKIEWPFLTLSKYHIYKTYTYTQFNKGNGSSIYIPKMFL